MTMAIGVVKDHTRTERRDAKGQRYLLVHRMVEWEKNETLGQGLLGAKGYRLTLKGNVAN